MPMTIVDPGTAQTFLLVLKVLPQKTESPKNTTLLLVLKVLPQKLRVQKTQPCY